jgi:hypothetical protein
MEGQVFTVPGIDVGQTHSGSLEGIPMIMCGSLHQGVSPLRSRQRNFSTHSISAPSYIVPATLDFITN